MDTNLISKLLNENKYSQAKDLLLNLLKNNPRNVEYGFFYGIILAQEKNYNKALPFFLDVLKVDENHYDSNFNAAGCYQGLLLFDKAIVYYENCTKIVSTKYEAYQQIGVCYKQLREYERSILNLKKALEISQNSNTYYVLGNVYRESGLFKEAEDSFISSLKINKKNIKSKLSLANLEIDKCNYYKSEKLIEEIIKSKETSNEEKLIAKTLIGNIFKAQGNYQKAIDLNLSVLEERPEDVHASYNLSLCYLFIKEFNKAWPYHESRFNLENLVLLKQIHNNIDKPRWDITRPKKNILVYGEQGIGEQVLYSQYLEVIYNQFENLTIAVSEKLIPFFERIFINSKVIDYKLINHFHDYEYHLPFGSLGLFFQKYITKENLIKKIDYPIDTKKVPEKIKKIRCGISWKSTNNIFGNKKSIELIKFKDIFVKENIEFINLQYSNEQDDISLLESKLDKRIFTKHNVDCFNDIDGVASLVKSCDYIITVSNSNAHLAGKLGIKTFLLLPLNDGKLWYWGQNQDNEILWYPSITPLRQKDEGSWDRCIQNIENIFENYL